MFIVRRFPDVLTWKESVRLHMVLIVAAVTTSITLCSVAHLATDPVLVRLGVIGAVAVLQFTVTLKLANEYPFFLSHRHCINQLLAIFFVAIGLLCSGVPDMTVTLALELA